MVCVALAECCTGVNSNFMQFWEGTANYSLYQTPEEYVTHDNLAHLFTVRSGLTWLVHVQKRAGPFDFLNQHM